MNHSFDSQDVMELKHASRSRFWGLKEPQDMPNNLAWGQLWSSELRAINGHHEYCEFGELHMGGIDGVYFIK